MRRRPTRLNADLSDILNIVAPFQPSTAKPSEHSLPRFHDNPYVRFLAAKPKMDALTRRIYPSTMLTKIGVTSNRELGVMSVIKFFNGSRVWVSSSPAITKVPPEIRGKFATNQPWIAQLKEEPSYGAKSVLLQDIRLNLLKYRERKESTGRPIICKIGFDSNLKSTGADLVPLYDISGHPELLELEMPDQIESVTSGLHLAGNLFKYLYIQRKAEKLK